MTCEKCTEQITIHADGTAACGCELRSLAELLAGKTDPAGWDAELVTRDAAKEVLMSAIDDEELADFVHESVDEPAVLLRAKGDIELAISLCQAALADFKAEA